MATVFTVPPLAVAPAVLVPVVLLTTTGLDAGRQLRALTPWWSVALLVMAVHILTTTEAAPLGRPSWAGAVAGLVALTRVAGSAAWLAVLMRTVPLDELVSAVRWWFRPLRRLGLRDEDLPLMLVVALGTAPTVLGEARRIEAVVRLRQGSATANYRRNWMSRVRNRARVVVPLLETLMRRAEALGLSLRRRRPVGLDVGEPSWSARLTLLIWTVALVLTTWARLKAGGGA